MKMTYLTLSHGFFHLFTIRLNLQHSSDEEGECYAISIESKNN